MNYKVCTKCGKKKLLDEFPKHSGHKDGLQSHCRECKSLTDKEYRKKNTKRIDKRIKKWRKDNHSRMKNQLKTYHLCSQYGLTPEEHYQMWVDQNGCCAICNSPIAYKNKVHTDHNHITDKVRGLLCKKCNTGLGMFLSDEKGTALLNSAIKYLRKYDGASIR